MSRYDLDVRVARIGVRHLKIIQMLNAKGIKVSPSEYSQFKGGVMSPKAELVMSEADKIMSELEAQRKRQKVSS